MKKHLNGFRPMSRKEQEEMSGGSTFSWFTSDEYGYAAGSTGTSSKSSRGSQSTTSTSSTTSSPSPAQTKIKASGTPAPKVVPQNTSSVDKTIKATGGGGTKETGSAIKLSTESSNSNTRINSRTNVISTSAPTSKTQVKTQAKTQSSTQTSLSTESNNLKPEITTSSQNKEKNQLTSPQKYNPVPEQSYDSFLKDDSEMNTISNSEKHYLKISNLVDSESEYQDPIKIEPESRTRTNQEIGAEQMGLWLDQRYLGEEDGGFCLAASLLNLYQSRDVQISERQAMGIMKEAMVTRSWNHNPVVSQNGFVQEPDTFLAIASRHLGQETLSTNDRKYHNGTLHFAGQTTGLNQGNGQLSLSIAQGYLNSFREHMGYGNIDVAGLVVELKNGDRTHFVSVQGWSLTNIMDPHGGIDRSDWSIASVRVVT